MRLISINNYDAIIEGPLKCRDRLSNRQLSYWEKCDRVTAYVMYGSCRSCIVTANPLVIVMLISLVNCVINDAVDIIPPYYFSICVSTVRQVESII